MKNGKDGCLESWIWDTACSNRGAKPEEGRALLGGIGV